MGADDVPGYRLAIRGQYDGIYGALSPDAARARHAALAPYVERVLVALDAPEDGWHLDLGCGDGLLALALARIRPRMRVLGLDGSPRALALARTLAARLPNLAFLEGDAEAPPEASYQRMSALSLFNLLPDKPRALAAWRAVAAPGARLVVTDAFVAAGAGTMRAGAASPQGLAQVARAAGWRVARREDLTPLVAKLHASGAWAWPEYVRPGFRYALLALDAI